MKKMVIPDFVQDNSFRVKIEYNPPADLTGAIFNLTLKRDATDVAPAMSFQHIAGSNPLDNPLVGVVYLDVPREVTSAVPEGIYLGQLDVTLGTLTTTLLRSGVDNVSKVVVTRTLREYIV